MSSSAVSGLISSLSYSICLKAGVYSKFSNLSSECESIRDGKSKWADSQLNSDSAGG